MLRKFIFSFVLVMLSSFGVMAQSNFIVGLDSGYAFAGTTNSILKAYNNSNPELIEPFKDLKFMFGLNLGYRYRANYTAFTISYQSMKNSRSVLGNNDMNQSFQNKANFTLNGLHFGFELGPRKLNFGATVGTRKVKVKYKEGNNSSFEIYDESRNWVSKFYVNIGARGNSINSLALRPFIDFAWGESEVTNLSTKLNNTTARLDDAFHMIGLSLIFFNGPQ